MPKYWKTLAAAILLAGAASGIAVADGYEPVGKGFAPPPVTNWSGVYLGIDGGYAWSDTDATVVFSDEDDLDEGERFSFDPDNGIWGGHLGIQQQYGKWVFGLEAAIYSTNLDDSDSVLVETTPDEFARFDVEIDEIYLLTARLAYAAGNWLPYMKAGFAAADIDLTGAEIEGGVAEANYRSPSEWHNGWVVGGGVEYLHNRRYRIGVEYNYIDLGNETHSGAFLNLEKTRKS